jgi:hypothetical protein
MRKMKFRILKKPIRFVSMTLAFFTLITGTHAATITKAATDLAAGASWGGSTAPN